LGSIKISNGNEACCTIPPVQADYTHKGEFTTLANLKTYKTGPAEAKTAIILIYDVFGFGAQIQQGADLLGHATSGPRQYQVLIPDFLEGNLADPGWFPPDSAEKQQAMGKYFGPAGPAGAGVMLGKLASVVEAVKESGIEKIAVVGYCWGAKVRTYLCVLVLLLSTDERWVYRLFPCPLLQARPSALQQKSIRPP
jgi:dienelactone hydrolase